METALVAWFSGTGNTALAASWIKDLFLKSGVTVHELCRFIKPYPVLPDYSRLFILFPVYACGLPHLFRQWMKQIPEGHGRSAQILCTNGEVDIRRSFPGFEGQALTEAAAILKKKGYIVPFAQTVGMPANITAVMPAPDDRDCRELIAEARVRVLKEWGPQILNSETNIRRCPPVHRVWSSLFSLLYRKMGRHFIGKLFSAGPGCNGCGLCAAECPAGAIIIKGNKKVPRWKWNCEGCMHCINYCPRNAVQTSLIRILLYIICCIIPVTGMILNNPVYKNLEWPGIIIFWAVSSTFLFFLAEKVLFLVESRFRNIRAFFISHTRNFKRYQARQFSEKE